MAYESNSFAEHHLTRLPVLSKLLELGWERDQIQCPGPDSNDKEWRVPKNPSSAARRESNASFDGFPVDIAIFDSASHKGDWRHAKIIIECKTAGDSTGLSELETYMGLEPQVRLGVLTDGTSFTKVYKLPSGNYSVVESAELPAPNENLILKENVCYSDLKVPESDLLKSLFASLLDLVVSEDSKSTRPEARLNQICNLILVKLQSDLDARAIKAKSVDFQIEDTPIASQSGINRLFKRYKSDRRDLFSDDEPDQILFDSTTIHAAVAELQRFDLVDVSPEALSLAFQVFRNANLKVGDGQYFTPARVVSAATKMMCIEPTDKVIDIACGTGGFLSQAYLTILDKIPEADAVRWANAKLYGIDRDDINVKLARALMVGVGDGSTHVKLGDSIRKAKWADYGHGLADSLQDDSYDVVLTNPPFGKNLKLSATDAGYDNLTICKHSKNGKPSDSYCSTELGIAFVERAWRLLHKGGRLGIVLPETYFFSASYKWFRDWLDAHFALKGVLNIPMEAFQGFCRAKTNFYVFEKSEEGASDNFDSTPWFIGNYTWVSNAPTIGINKDGRTLYVVSRAENRRTSDIDDKAIEDVISLIDGDGETDTASFYPTKPLSESLLGVPQYCDRRSTIAVEKWISENLKGFWPVSLGELVDKGIIKSRGGHGSPSQDFRNGDIPYIKVSDLRNRQVNINSTNMVTLQTAKKFWKSSVSGINPWDVITPARASKNIGEPVMVLPGQEKAVYTKEVLILRAAESAPIDNFYIAWALMLPSVQAQWSRVVLMQTNREDLGDRWREVVVPFSDDVAATKKVSKDVKNYYLGLSMLNDSLASSLSKWG